MAKKENTAEAVRAPAPLQSAEAIQKQIKPLSDNSFVAFFQKIGRGWLTIWYGFADRHPKLAKIIYMLFFFVLFSQAVTVFQFLVFLFLPHLFGTDLAANPWMFPKDIKLGEITHAAGVLNGVPYDEWKEQFFFFILGKPLAHNEAGRVVIGGGLGYFFAFLIATFLAQCINFPLQRNITFKSHGNPVWQATWYFIGWLLIQPFCDMIGSLWKYLVWGVIGASLPVGVVVLLDTVVMGGVSMAIFFFVFLVIFPDYNAVAKRAKAKYEKLKAAGADAAKIKKAEAAVADAEMKAKLSNTEKAAAKAKTQASSKAIAYFATLNAAEKAKADVAALSNGGDQAKLEKAKQTLQTQQSFVPMRHQAVSDAIIIKDEADAAFAAAKAEAEKLKTATAAA